MKFNNFFKNKTIILIIGIIFLALIIAIVLFFIFTNYNTHDQIEDIIVSLKNQSDDSECETRSVLDGTCLSEDTLEYPQMAAVMIENHVDSRPQSGLARAPLVIEAEVEGHITRFLAFFPLDLEIEKIGPVRSARPYYLDWTKEFKALYAHVGGSPQALQDIDIYNIEDLDQFFWSSYFWRSQDRYAPHNVYTSTDLLVKAAKQKFIDIDEQNSFGTWLFKDDLAEEQRNQNVSDLVINFANGNSYKVVWKYNYPDNNYQRYLNGSSHLDQDSSEIKAKNICVLFTEYYPIDDVGRLFMKTIGSGKAIVFQDGGIIQGSWEKDSMKERLRFFDEADQEVEFNTGTTWIEVVNNYVEINY